MNTIAWIGFCQSLFAAILMIAKKKNSQPDKILSGWLVLLSIDFLSCGLNYEFFNEPLLISSFLLFNPSLYLYIHSLTSSVFKLRWIHLLHLLPFLFFSIFSYVLKLPFSLDTFFQNDQYYFFRLAFAFANFISWLVYGPLSLKLVVNHRKNLQNELSNISKNENLGWVLFLTVFYLSYCLVAFIISIIAYFLELNPLSPHIYNYSTLLLLIYIMSFYGLRQRTVPKKLLSNELHIPYEKSVLDNKTKKEIKEKIISYFENEQVYLQSDLNMAALSKSLKIPKYQLTEVLNTEIGKNFFQFVNHYRVEAVKKMLADKNNKFSIEAIGYDCGFNSKSSFYTVFKKLTGETPVTYRNSVI